MIGADGRNGIVAQQIGCRLTRDPEHHLFSGMLVEGADDWPQELQGIGTEGDVNWLVFPQGEGRARTYLGFASAQRTRLLGPEALPAEVFAEPFVTRVIGGPIWN